MAIHPEAQKCIDICNKIIDLTGEIKKTWKAEKESIISKLPDDALVPCRGCKRPTPLSHMVHGYCPVCDNEITDSKAQEKAPWD